MIIIFELFDTLVKPVVLYGAEVWGCENCDIVNKVKLRLCKYPLHVHKSTCSNMVYGELCETPLHTDIKCKMILYLEERKISRRALFLGVFSNKNKHCLTLIFH